MKHNERPPGGKSAGRTSRKKRTSPPPPGTSSYRLVIDANLLPWYNELSDMLDIFDPTFPAGIRKKIEAFGEFEIELISFKRTSLIRKTKMNEQ